MTTAIWPAGSQPLLLDRLPAWPTSLVWVPLSSQTRAPERRYVRLSWETPGGAWSLHSN